MRKHMPPWLFLAFAFVLAFAAPPKALSDPLDFVIAAPQAIKMYYGYTAMAGVMSSVVLYIFPTAILVGGEQPSPDPLGFATESLVAAALATALALPATFIVVNAIKGDAASTATWRRVAFWVDAALTAAAIGAGIYWSLPENIPKQPAEIRGFEGPVFLLVSIPLGGATAMDLVPYSFERK
jgi:hypothetical protein